MATPSTPEGTPAAEAQTEAGFEHKASEAVVKQMKMGQFMRENIKKWKDVVPLLKELQKRFPKRQAPREYPGHEKLPAMCRHCTGNYQRGENCGIAGRISI